MEEYIQSDDHNRVNKEQDAPIQEDQKDIEITGVNKISDTESKSPNMRISERERHPLERLEPTTKLQVYMQSPKVKKIDKQTKSEPTIRFLSETNKNSALKEYIHNMVSHTDEKI